VYSSELFTIETLTRAEPVLEGGDIPKVPAPLAIVLPPGAQADLFLAQLFVESTQSIAFAGHKVRPESLDGDGESRLQEGNTKGPRRSKWEVGSARNFGGQFDLDLLSQFLNNLQV